MLIFRAETESQIDRPSMGPHQPGINKVLNIYRNVKFFCIIYKLQQVNRYGNGFTSATIISIFYNAAQKLNFLFSLVPFSVCSSLDL